MVINLLSSPRNVSTALMYSFAQRADTKVMDEPFYANYLANVAIDHPGKEEILVSMPTDYESIIKDIEALRTRNKYVFIKNMAHHFIDRDVHFMNSFQNVFFIRHPAQIITSFSKVIDNPTIQDIGVRMQLELFEKLTKSSLKRPVVVDSEDLINDPQKLLSALCNKIDIPFEVSMLRWNKGGIPEDGIWAKYWYANVHDSNGFKPAKNNDVNGVPKHLTGLLEESIPYYIELHQHKIKI